MINNLCFSSNEGQVGWSGKCVENEAEFKVFLTGPTRSRLFDEEQHSQFEADLRALATTGMASDTITRLLASEPEKKSWEIGEALAECLLEEERGVKFPWNSGRDKRTPKASLPGADLVGFIENGDEAVLVLGEVKTSSDANNPPQVMNGKSGMTFNTNQDWTTMVLKLRIMGKSSIDYHEYWHSWERANEVAIMRVRI